MLEFNEQLIELGKISIIKKYKGSKYHLKKLLESCLNRRQVFYRLKELKECALRNNLPWIDRLPGDKNA